MNRTRWTIVAVTALALAASPPTRAGAPPELWLYQGANLADSASTARIEPVWRRAAAAGYSRVVLVDPKFARLDALDAAYFRRLARLRALAAELHLEIIPGVSLVGRGQGALLAMDPNLAEALPVRDALLEVRGGIARVVAEPPVALATRPDETDLLVQLHGASAVIPANGVSHVAWTVDVSPQRCYHVRVQLRGRDFRGEPRIRVTGNGRELAHAMIAVPADAADEQRDVVFNSLDSRRVRIAFSVARGARGVLEWSHWSLEEAGPVNLVRRPGLPFTLAGLVEGRDYAPVRDSLLGQRPWRGQFDTWHVPPTIRVNRPDGTRLRASWHHAAVLLRGQVACCLSDTAVLRRQAHEIVRMRALLGARTVFLMHDEIRTLARDATCTATGATAAEVLAANVRACVAAAGDARVLVWNDMFDPLHNAILDYYLANGDLSGALALLPREVTVVNWNAAHLEASLRGLASHGHRQVFAGYYDGRPGDIRAVLPVLERAGVDAILYTTWQDRYDDLEAFARSVRGR